MPKGKQGFQKGKDNPMFNRHPPNYKGGTVTVSGSRHIQYVDVTVGNKKLKKHRLIMESVLGRKLSSNEVVHHIDGNGLNNNLDNLRVMDKADHVSMHANASNLKGGGHYEVC